MTMLQHYLRIFFSLIAIGALLYLIYYVLSIFPNNKVINKKNKRLQFIEQMYISAGIVIYLVKVDNQEFLLGVSSKTINFIHPLSESSQDFAKVLSETKVNNRNIKNKTAVKGK